MSVSPGKVHAGVTCSYWSDTLTLPGVEDSSRRPVRQQKGSLPSPGLCCQSLAADSGRQSVVSLQVSSLSTTEQKVKGES